MLTTRRRVIGLGAGVAAATTGLAGCGSQQSIGGPGELSMWTWGGSVNDDLIRQAEQAIPGAPGMRLSMTRIGTNYNTKVRTALAARSMVPDIVAINSDVATYFPNADQFHDLFALGAKDDAASFLPWKWKLGITPQNRMIAYPMDTGPTALFYRQDILDRAGVPTDPAELAAAAPDWDSYLRVARQIRSAVPGSVITDTVSSVYDAVLAQQTQLYLTPDGQYIGDHDHVRRAWDWACQVASDGLSANAAGSDSSAIVTSGRLVARIAAVWWAQLGPKNAAPKTAGRWRVTAPPGGAGNQGGSFLAITKYCKNPQAAFALIRWLESAKNQSQAFLDPVLFPSTPASYTDPRMLAPDPFFGQQRIVDVFGASAREYPGAYASPYDSVIGAALGAELVNVEAGTKSSDRAWRDAQQRVRRELDRVGMI